MAKRRSIELTDEARAKLEQWRATSKKAYLRERAAAILKVADGMSASKVATTGLLKPHDPDIIYGWLDRFEAEGCDGLIIRPGRGRKPAFSPSAPTDEAAKVAVRDIVGRDPGFFGFDRSRWTLDMIREACDWLGITTISGIHGLLDRLKIGWKHGRDHVHSPDRLYEEKKAAIAQIAAEVEESAGEIILVYQDEVTIYRQPTISFAYALRGADEPLAERSHQANTITRYAATLDHCTGQVIFRRASHIGVKELVKLYQDLCRAYPGARVIYVVQDNWPVHVHPDVLVALQKQETPYLSRGPANWPTEPSEKAKKAWGELQLPIQLVPLPTYASWLNPIEKLWRWTKQEIVHHHRLANDLAAFRCKLDTFLAQFAGPSPELLRYVGLGVPA